MFSDQRDDVSLMIATLKDKMIENCYRYFMETFVKINSIKEKKNLEKLSFSQNNLNNWIIDSILTDMKWNNTVTKKYCKDFMRFFKNQ